MTDEEYLIGLLNRDEEILSELMDTYMKLLWAVGSKYLNHQQGVTIQDIEELVSDVFIRLWKNPKGFNPSKGSLKTYLCMMTRSMALNKMKQTSKDVTVELDDSIKATLTKEESSMDWQSFYQAVMTLEEPTREIIIKRYFYEMKPKEIQEKTGYDSKLIDNKLYQGKKKLQKQFRELGGEIG
ncbi:RNA polymerase sigma factor [Vagococcus bubulae]|uniref:RNA polymerase sigma-70 region 2 domain-containing protein n=1 Tax=Vagococcus bubulae TaxID=1977868 RepID=A0A429ZQD8_9ENTE|nr:sigma-70 family RNA polymerase sigma factor [Vagococcus bubulae]RST95895.1 hypothetical protein CBF36_01635 [Vagococcus bubulae]